jgi:hypothetical protein
VRIAVISACTVAPTDGDQKSGGDEPSGYIPLGVMASVRSKDDRSQRLLEVGRTLVSEHDTEAVLDRILHAARDVTGARYAALGVLDEQRTELERFLTLGVDDATHRAIGDLPRGRGVLGVLIEDPRRSA